MFKALHIAFQNLVFLFSALVLDGGHALPLAAFFVHLLVLPDC